jgi:hypothetical protein
LAPNFKLFDGCGAEGIRGTKQNTASFGFEARGKLADRSSLTRAIYADDHDDSRRLRDVRHRSGDGLQDLQQLLADEPAKFRSIIEHVTLGAILDALDNLGCGSDADIRADERVLKLIEQVRVDYFLAL